jgi:RimJ/RimL family protein N-acetyltransferase
MNELTPTTLSGSHVALVPLTRAHYQALCAIGLDPDLWRLTTNRVETSGDMGRYLDNALAAGAAGTALPFAVTLRSTNEVVGTSRFYAYVRDHRRIEIGFTWIAGPWQRTAVNTETKYLMLRHAFETLGVQRVEFKADADNDRSRQALLRIGATEEGTLRHYMWAAHRGSRDVRVFSILAEEWSGLKNRLESLLAVAVPH